MDSDNDDEEGDEGEVDDGVDEDGDGAGLQVAELDDVVAAGELDEQPRREEHEQHQADHHGAPVRHPACLQCRQKV